MPTIWEYIDWGRKMVEAARNDANEDSMDEILDGVEGHFDNIERELQSLESQHWLLTASGGGMHGIANVMVIEAETEEQAREKAGDYVSKGTNHGTVKARRVGDFAEHGDVWSYCL